jgi:hypothetical protein
MSPRHLEQFTNSLSSTSVAEISLSALQRGQTMVTWEKQAEAINSPPHSGGSFNLKRSGQLTLSVGLPGNRNALTMPRSIAEKCPSGESESQARSPRSCIFGTAAGIRRVDPECVWRSEADAPIEPPLAPAAGG